MKFVSDQRKLSNAIDGEFWPNNRMITVPLARDACCLLLCFLYIELRRMNMRAIVGQKDVFLSYSHININFARRIKVGRPVWCMLDKSW